jgi:hypothetical protein
MPAAAGPINPPPAATAPPPAATGPTPGGTIPPPAGTCAREVVAKEGRATSAGSSMLGNIFGR